MGLLERFGLKTKNVIVPSTFNPTDFTTGESFKLYKPDLKEAAKSTVQTLESGVYWEFPDVPFRSIYEYMKKDPGIQSAWNTYRNMIIGSGFYNTADDQKVLDFVNDWNIDSDFENKLTMCIGDAILLGCSLAEIVKSGSDFDIVPVDMRTISAVQRDKFGNIEYYIQQTINNAFKKLPASGFIKMGMIDVGRQAWPIGIFHSMIVPFFEFENEPWSLADGAALMRQDALRLIHKMSAPRIWHVYENANEEKLKAQAQRDKGMRAGERGYVNSKFEIMQESVDGSQRFLDKTEFITNAIENALQAPTAKIMTASGISNATYASAEAAEEMFEKHLIGIQRKWKRQIEHQIYGPLLKLNGYDLTKSKLEYNWGAQQLPEIDLNQVMGFVSQGVVTKQEARKYLADTGFPLDENAVLPEDEAPEQEEIKQEKRRKRTKEEIELDNLRKEAYRRILRKLDEK